MKKKIYIVNWCYNHRGQFDCGSNAHTTEKAALEDMRECYNQAIFNITPNGVETELDTNDYCEIEKRVGGYCGWYDVERYAADSWERCEVVEKEIEFPDEEDKEPEEDLETTNLEMWDGGYRDEDLVGYEVVLWPDSQYLMELDGFYENAYLINDIEGLEMFGSAAYVVDKNWLDKQDCETITKY